MTPALLTFIINEALTYGPGVISALAKLFASGEPTLDQLQALRHQIESETYAKFVPQTALTAGNAATVASQPANAAASQPAEPAPDNIIKLADAGAQPVTDQVVAPVADPLTSGTAPGHTSPTAPLS